jgi:type III pantothenate kinase
MILLDCGNSAIKAQFREQDRLRASFSCSYAPGWLEAFIKWLEGCQASHCYICSVLASEHSAGIENALKPVFGDRVTRFRSQPEAPGLINAYRQPERLGVDRWMAMIGAVALNPGHCIVVDAGSAITLDLIRADGQHLGGAILPGVRTSIDNFKRIFSHIKLDESAGLQNQPPGCTTETAIRLNYDTDPVTATVELIHRWAGLFDSQPCVLLTGGDAGKIQQQLGSSARILPDLVFQGMRELIIKNR